MNDKLLAKIKALEAYIITLEKAILNAADGDCDDIEDIAEELQEVK